ncbi:hypothetical protein BA190_27455 [Labrys sp. WJW]|uniref:hypothetical protein n=1 Tax=Labrys sp. WJW TaxID=1737983 RepID=UPI0008296AB1|nr:hypothetical protein [Labrys sp. WJW]OCC01701.1 hypothetical protein BA190_27455 [Labrys sp. WJW]
MDGESNKHVSGLKGGDGDAHVERAPFMFDPWLTCVPLPGKKNTLVRVLAENVALNFHRLEKRQRRRKERDQENLERILLALFSNLAFAAACWGENAPVAVSLRSAKQKLSRYDARGFGYLPAVLEQLSQHGTGGVERLLTLQKSNRRGVASTVSAGDIFGGGESGLRLQPENFARQPGAETIRLSRTTRDYVADTRDIEPIEYDDTPETLRYREEMGRINAYLAAASIDLQAPREQRMGVFVQRELRRHFKLPEGAEAPRFDLGGRLFGGWWQNLSSAQRAAIRIDGEQITDLDFNSMFLRLAYIEVGLTPPTAGDLYGEVLGGAGTSMARTGVKKVANAMLFRSSRLTRMPADAVDYFGPGATGAWIRGRILDAHRPIADVFEQGLGLKFMFIESQILVSALLRLSDAGVTALPMHDGLMVAESKMDVAVKAMWDASQSITGHRLTVSRKEPKTL